MGKFCALFLCFTFSLFCRESTSSSENNSVLVPPVEKGSQKIDKESPKAAPVSPEKPQSFRLMPHKAVYSVRLDPLKKQNNQMVDNVTGKCVIEVVKTKEGWSYDQSLEIQVYYNDSTTSVIKRIVTSWESPTDLSFHIENIRDGATESILHGGAELGENKEWNVYFKKPEMDGFITDQSLVFPIHYIEKVLDAIQNGKNVLSDQIVFDATHEMQKPLRVNTVIIPLKEKKVSIKDDSLLPSDKIWCLQKAMYDIESSNTVPDYEEQKIDLFSTGVISSMEANWGEGITIQLNLRELTVYQ